MRLSNDERRALAFVGLLLALSAAARLLDRPTTVLPDAPAADVAALEARGDSIAADEARRSRPLIEGERIDPNGAPAAELDRLPGVGPALADRIVASRRRDGAFRSVHDLLRVSGIGERTLERMTPWLAIARVRPRRAPPPPRAPRGTSERTRPGGSERAPRTVDPNRATAAELQTLPGIGPVLARRILAVRDSLGRFGSVAELERVPGIGPKTLERLTPRLRLRKP